MKAIFIGLLLIGSIAHAQEYSFDGIQVLGKRDDQGIIDVKSITYAMQGEAPKDGDIPTKIQKMAIEYCGNRKPSYETKEVDLKQDERGLKAGKVTAISISCNDAVGENVYVLSVNKNDGLVCKPRSLRVDASTRIKQTRSNLVKNNCFESEGWIRLQATDGRSVHMFFGDKGHKVCEQMEHEFVQVFGTKEEFGDKLKAREGDWFERSISASVEKRLNCNPAKDQIAIDELNKHLAKKKLQQKTGH